MRADHDPLDESDDAMPVSPTRRRRAIVVGLLLALALLAALIWFSAEHTETRDTRGLMGHAPAPLPPVDAQG